MPQQSQCSSTPAGSAQARVWRAQALLRSDTLRLMLPGQDDSVSLDAGAGGVRGGSGWPPAGDSADAMRTPSLEARQASRLAARPPFGSLDC